MRSNLTYLGVVLALSATMLNGCYYDNMEELYPMPVDTDTVVTFADDILPFFQTTCATSSGCHASGSSYPVFETYAVISSNVDRIKARVIDKNPSQMPPAGNAQPTESELADLQTWIDDGAPNN